MVSLPFFVDNHKPVSIYFAKNAADQTSYLTVKRWWLAICRSADSKAIVMTSKQHLKVVGKCYHIFFITTSNLTLHSYGAESSQHRQMPTQTSFKFHDMYSSLKTKHKNTQDKRKYDLTCNKNKYVNQTPSVLSNKWLTMKININEIKSLRNCFWVGSPFDVQYKSWDLKQTISLSILSRCNWTEGLK